MSKTSLPTRFRRTLPLAAMVIAPALFVGPVAARDTHPYEFTLYGGYRVGGRFEVEDGRLILGESGAFAGTFGYRASPDLIMDVTYTRQETDLAFQPTSSGHATPISDVTVEALYLDATYEHGYGSTRPFAGLGIGANKWTPDIVDVDSQTRFSFNFTGGLRTDLSRAFGLKFMVRGTFTTPPDDGSSVACSPEGVCYVQAGNSLISQFDFGLGLVIRP